MKNSAPMPPKWAQRFLLWFLRPELAEEVQGDLEEQFYFYLESGQSLGKARLNYWYQVLHYLRPFAIHLPNLMSYIHIPMIKNYFIVAWRNLLRYKLYSAIKIGGFALGIAACFLIALYIVDELSYDQHYPQTDEIYRVLAVSSKPGEEAKWAALSPPVKKVLEEEIPEIEKVGRLVPYNFFDGGSNQIRPEGHELTVYEEGFAYADQEFIEILDLPMVYGDLSQALTKPNTILISRRKAEKYFPKENPVGKTLILNEEMDKPYTIGGVMENLPKNSHVQCDFFMTLKGVEFWPGEQTSWCCSNYDTYLLLKPNSNITALEEKLLVIRDKHLVPYYQKQNNQMVKDMKKYGFYELQAIKDIHLSSEGVHDIFQHGDMRIVWMFGMIASLILALAIINFVNIATAKSANRAKEVGLRKVIGSQKYQLIQHFLTESTLYSIASLLLGISLVNLMLPFFNHISGKSLSFPWEAWWWLIPFLLLGGLFMGILSGLYPAFYLSAFQPIQVLKGNVRQGAKSAGLRSILVVFQFTAAMVLIIGAIIVNRQMNFILNKKLGYNKNQVLVLHGTNILDNQIKAFKEELLKIPSIENVTYSMHLPVSGTRRNGNTFWKEGKEQLDIGISGQRWDIDPDYIPTLGMKVIEGRNFSEDRASDSSATVINQAMAKELGLKKPIGEIISNGNNYRVIGVVEDFHFESVKGEISPLMFTLQNREIEMAAIKIQPAAMKSSLEEIKKIWDKFAPTQAIRYSFLDERYAIMYEDVQRTETIFNVFATLAIIVACIGLFALSSFMAEQRRKEISIRKVLGASSSNLFKLLTFRFLRLIIISFVIAIPLSWYFMKEWLNNYAYRISLSWDIFLISGFIILAITLLTISYESIRVIRMNPVDNLQSE